jgi:protein involved in polysaccharide export with SLBB domain
MDPGLGYPVPVRDDGYISLPLVTPIRVTGLTLSQAERKIVGAYTKDKKILLEGNEKIIVTLMKRRTYNVLVIREDGQTDRANVSSIRKNDIYIGEDTQAESFSIELPAYENDVLHALSETGGLPGEKALNEIFVLRGGQNAGSNGSVIQAVGAPYMGGISPTIDGANAVRIPIRGEQGSFPSISEQDIILKDGDIVYIKGREREVFYTGGLLPGGRYPIPRDYDIDVMEAIALAGGSGTSSSGAAGGSIRLGQVKPATQVTILRKCGCEQVAIAVDLRYTMADPSERVIIQPGDMIVLEFGGIFNLFR